MDVGLILTQFHPNLIEICMTSLWFVLATSIIVSPWLRSKPNLDQILDLDGFKWS
jgi:hypothetical protein